MMSPEIVGLEQEIAARRAKLNDTIDRIQDKLTVSGIVDEVIAQTGAARIGGSGGAVSGFLRRYPLPLMVAAAGIGFFMYRQRRRATAALDLAGYDDADLDPTALDAPAVLNDGRARRYEPDGPSRHPGADEALAGRHPFTQA